MLGGNFPYRVPIYLNYSWESEIEIYICMHTSTHPHLYEEGSGTGMKWSKRGEEKERDRKGEGGGDGREGDSPDNSSVQKISCLFSIVNEHINLCVFKFLGVRSETEDQLNWMLLKLDEIFMLI